MRENPGHYDNRDYDNDNDNDNDANSTLLSSAPFLGHAFLLNPLIETQMRDHFSLEPTGQTMQLTRADLYSLEEYARCRPQFRARVMAHKQDRRVALGAHATLYFEDRLTIQYQVQEMLRAERIFESAGIQDELDAYNPLVPDGCNWKATFMIEYDDASEREAALVRLRGIETRVWVQIADQARVYAIADEDLEREDATKTSAVHFLRFELTPAMAAAVTAGAPIGIGSDHPDYCCETQVGPPARACLAADLA